MLVVLLICRYYADILEVRICVYVPIDISRVLAMPTIEMRKEHETDVTDMLSKMKKDVHSVIIHSIDDFVASSGVAETAPGLPDMLRYYPDSLGKYSRPSIMMLCAMALGAKYEECILPAAAIQLSEDFVLVHDDIVDGSLLRRGRNTLHSVYGVDRAINAGDILHATLEELLHHVSKLENGEAVYKKFREIGNITAIGQDMDIFYTGSNALQATESTYISIAAYKTSAYSVYGPLQIGALIAGAEISVLNALKGIGLPSGIAFQINDDIRDITGKATGKDPYGDIRQGKTTLISVNTYKDADSKGKESMEHVYSKNPENKTNEDIKAVLDLMMSTGSIDYAADVKERYEKSAVDALLESQSLVPENAYSVKLMKLIGSLYSR